MTHARFFFVSCRRRGFDDGKSKPSLRQVWGGAMAKNINSQGCAQNRPGQAPRGSKAPNAPPGLARCELLMKMAKQPGELPVAALSIG